MGVKVMVGVGVCVPVLVGVGVCVVVFVGVGVTEIILVGVGVDVLVGVGVGVGIGLKEHKLILTPFQIVFGMDKVTEVKGAGVVISNNPPSADVLFAPIVLRFITK